MRGKPLVLALCAAGVCLAFAGCAGTENSTGEASSEEDRNGTGSSSYSATYGTSSGEEDTSSAGLDGSSEGGTASSSMVEGITAEIQELALAEAEAYYQENGSDAPALTLCTEEDRYAVYQAAYEPGELVIFEAADSSDASGTVKYLTLGFSSSTGEWSVLSDSY